MKRPNQGHQTALLNSFIPYSQLMETDELHFDQHNTTPMALVTEINCQRH